MLVFSHLGVTSLRAKRNPRCHSETEKERGEKEGKKLALGGPGGAEKG